MNYEKLAWDSDFFGLALGRTGPAANTARGLTEAVALADGDGIRCLYHLVDAQSLDRLHAALAIGFVPYDIRIEFERALVWGVSPDSTVPIRPATAGDEELLANLAAQTITGTRFARDPHFPAWLIPEFYRAWVKRGLASGEQRVVLLAEPDLGFVVCGVDAADAIGSIELIGVANGHTQRNIGRALMNEAHIVMLEAGCDQARVVTQGHNLAAQRLYQALGYRTRSVAWWLHRWRE